MHKQEWDSRENDSNCVDRLRDDGIDNDGDGLADGADPSCIIVE